MRQPTSPELMFPAASIIGSHTQGHCLSVLTTPGPGAGQPGPAAMPQSPLKSLTLARLSLSLVS